MKKRETEESGECSSMLAEDLSSREEAMVAGQGGSAWYEVLLQYQALAATIQGNFWLNRLVQKLQVLPIGKDLILMVKSASTWDRMAAARHGWLFSATVYLLPMLVFSGLIEAIGLYCHGQQQMVKGLTMERYSAERLAAFELVQAGGFLCLIFVAAVCLKNFGNACHRRNRLSQSLLVMTQAIGPLLFLQMFNGIPGMSVWFTWIPGVILVIASLYHGVPRIMRPDPPSAMGLFVAGSGVVFLLSLLWRLMTYWYFTGDFKGMDRLISSLAAWLM